MIGRLGLLLAFVLAGLTAGPSAAPAAPAAGAHAPGPAHHAPAATGVRPGTSGPLEFLALHGQPPKLGARGRTGPVGAPPAAVTARSARLTLAWRLLGASAVAARAVAAGRTALTWWGRAPPHAHA